MNLFSSKGEEQGYSRESHINFVNNAKASPLHMAVQSGDLEMIKMCLDNGAQLELMEVIVHARDVAFVLELSSGFSKCFTALL